VRCQAPWEGCLAGLHPSLHAALASCHGILLLGTMSLPSVHNCQPAAAPRAIRLLALQLILQLSRHFTLIFQLLLLVQ